VKKFLYVLAGIVVIVAVVAGIAYLARFEITRIQEDLPAFTDSAGDSYYKMVAMGDDIELNTYVALPASDGPHPTILLRNPYANFGAFMRDGLCGRFVRYGYACVFQDVRGQGESGGEWQPGVNEIKDGSDTLQWLIKQDFQDKNIAMVGPSYLAAVQWAAASVGLPAEVKTFVPAVYTTDNYGVMYQDGMFRHETFTAWASMMRSSNASVDNAGKDYQKAVRHRPHNEVDTKIFGTEMPWYQDMINSASPNAAFWHQADNMLLKTTPETLTVPILMIGGWYDVFFGPQFEDWQRLATRSGSRFVIGPWTHIGSGGEALETPNAEGGLFQWMVMLNWVDHHLKGMPLDYKPGVATYVMQENRWKERAVWPPEGDAHRLYLGAPVSAQGCNGGSLTRDLGKEVESISYQYDPDNPVPTLGGAGMLAFILPGFNGAKPANVEQGEICNREDVLSFTTETFNKSLHIAGNIKINLTVSSSAADTAFTAKLVEVMSDGKSVNIRDSITSLALTRGAIDRRTYTPGEKVNITINPWPIEWTIQPGSKLRLDISSSDFPKFHAHPNIAGNWAEAKKAITAQQTLYTGLENNSWLEFNVLQNDSVNDHNH
jgi:putative CocE/NonD family hydrolase